MSETTKPAAKPIGTPAHRLSLRRPIGRRSTLKLMAGAAAFSAPYLSRKAALAADPILIGVLVSQTAAAGVADDADHLNGTIMAIEEINAAGGVLGRPLETRVVDNDKLSAESVTQAIRSLVDQRVHAISNAFVFVPVPAMDASAGYKCPYLHGNTQRDGTEAVKANPDKYSHMFQTDPSEVHYGYHYPIWLEAMEKEAGWVPKNRGVHIVQEQVAYNQTISRTCKEALQRSSFELAAVTDIQFPVQDWGPVIQDILNVGAGAVMINHWVAAEYAAFCRQFRANPLADALVYLQYGPSQPEFLQLAGGAAEGFCWSTVLGVYADEKGMDFRRRYQERFPGIMGLCYTGNGYDIVHYLKAAWEATGDPDNFEAVCDWIRVNRFRGVCGMMDMNNEWQEAAHYPDNGFPVTAHNLEDGMGQLFFQVQDGEHKIIYPNSLAETKLRPAPWWG